MTRFNTMLLVSTLLGACGGSPAPAAESRAKEPGADAGDDAPAPEPADEESSATETVAGTAPSEEPAAPEPAKGTDFADRDGAAEARRDIDQGTLSLKTFGKPAPARFGYAKLLESELGVKLDAVAGCVVTEELVDFVRTYNQVVEAHLKIEHGDDVLEKLWRRAEKQLQDK